MAKNAYDSVGQTMDKAWVESFLDKVLAKGTEPPNIYFLPKDDPFWGVGGASDEKAQAMYYGPSITKDNPNWGEDFMMGVRDLGGVATTNNLFLPAGQEVSEDTVSIFGHELMHHLDDTMVPDVPSKGYESLFPYAAKSDFTQQDWVLNPMLAKYRETIPSAAFESAQSYGAEVRTKPTEALSYYTERERGIYPELFATKVAEKVLDDKAPEDINILDLSAYTQDVGDVRQAARYIGSEKLTDYGKGQYYFDPKGKGYDYARASELGYKRSDDPSGKDHLPSIDSETGMVLKGRGNKKEWNLMVDEEEKLGNIIVKGDTINKEKDRWYSVKQPKSLSKKDIFHRYPDLFKELYE